MADEIDRTINSVGFAKVIVAIKPGVHASAASLRRDLNDWFSPLNREDARNLAAAASREAGRRSKPRSSQSVPSMRVFPRLGLAVGRCDHDQLVALRKSAIVKGVELAPEISLIRPVSSTATATAEATAWGLTRLSLPQAWDMGHTGKGVIVAHLDTGIDASHPALKAALHAFTEFDLAGDQIKNAKPNDPDGHGTHTAGTIAGRATGKVRIGAAPEAKLASALVIEGGDVISRILGGLEWSIEQGATVLSMSLGLRGFTPAFQAVINALRANDVLPVIAIGNEGPSTSRSPGNYDNVISVGAMGENERVADFSSSMRFKRPDDPLTPDLAAPGENVRSAAVGGGYRFDSGTSMATPLVAGLAAVLRAAAPSANASDIEAAILKSCKRPASMPESRANRGVPDALRALAHLGIKPKAKSGTKKSESKAKIKTKTKT